MAKTEKTMTVEEDQKRQIEEMKNHPLWADFAEMYQERYSIVPEKSGVPPVMIDRWEVFLVGANAQLDLMQKILVEDAKMASSK